MLHITLFGNRKNTKSEGGTYKERERERESESADNLSLSIARRHQKTKQSSVDFAQQLRKNTAFLGQIHLSSRPLDRGEVEAQVALKIDTLNGSSAVQHVKATRTQCTV